MRMGHIWSNEIRVETRVRSLSFHTLEDEFDSLSTEPYQKHQAAPDKIKISFSIRQGQKSEEFPTPSCRKDHSSRLISCCSLALEERSGG